MSNVTTQPGDIVAEKYRVEKLLGEGGMGVVLAVRSLADGVRYAMKLVSGEIASDPVSVERFRREGRALIRIKSQHVVRMFDVGRLEDSTPYMVMEYLEGQSLSSLLEQQGACPIVQAADLMMQACDALTHAHALGIVHRDLKPSNLHLVRGANGINVLKVLDFGIAKHLGAGSAATVMNLTLPEQRVGSPRYMAPEQISSSRDLDLRVDIWAIGVTLYELLAGRAPFEGKTLITLYTEITLRDPPPLGGLRTDVPPGLIEVISRCMQKDREDRFRTAAELAWALRPFASASCTVDPAQLTALMGQGAYPALSSHPPTSRNGSGAPFEPAPFSGNAVGSQFPSQVPRSQVPAVPKTHVLAWLLLAFAFTVIVVSGGLLLLRRAAPSHHLPHSPQGTVPKGH